ncbi:MAG: LamG domain-containing protein, partial [Candidatus Aenigmarchaeota archaeon]|nr:LamG domain-containing protein [Candidatus Aenigmarchaeota archaeon]
ATPNDGYDDGAMVTSNNVTILDVTANTAPSVTAPNITPITAYTNSTLTTNTTYTDPESNSGTVYFLWYVNDTNVYNQTNTVVATGTTVIATLDGGNFSKGNQVNVSVYANDGSLDSTTLSSNITTIQNSMPTQSTPILNSTNPLTNDTNTNLTAYNISSADIDSDAVKNIFNWKVGGTPIAVLNMPFEGINNTATNNAWDYSGYGRNGTITSATWNATGGYDGKGAYEFDGNNDKIVIPTMPENLLTEITISVWIKPNETDLTTQCTQGGVLFCPILGSANNFLWEISNGFLTLYNYDITTPAWIANSVRIQAKSWSHVAFVYWSNRTTGNITYYVNGTQAGSTQTAGLNGTFNLSNLNIGDDGVSRWWNGSIDEVMIFNRSLSAQQINALYNNRTDLIVANETTVGQNWSVEITPNDGYEDGQMLESNNVTILNAKPTQSTPILNSTNPLTNDTNQNLTAYNISSADVDSDSIKSIFNWKINGTPIAVVNMPFEGINNTITNNSWDYSGNRFIAHDNGGVLWNATGGHDGKGAYSLDGGDDYVDTGLNFTSAQINSVNRTLTIFFKKAGNAANGVGTIIGIASVGNWGQEAGGGIFITDAGVYTCALGWNSTVYTTITGSTLSNNQWHFGTYVWDASKKIGSCYLDGAFISSKSSNSLSTNGLDYFVYVGRNGASTNSLGHGLFNGTVDDVMIFNRTLSAEQILALYNNRTDLIVANETSVGQNWSVEITPNDGYDDGQMLESNGVLILDKIGPTFSGAVNTSPNFRRYQNFTANITISDDVALDYYIFSTNASGAWANISTVDISGTSYSASEQANISTARGSPVCWLYYANDTSGNMVNSSLNCFTVANTLSTQATPILNSTNPLTNDTNQNLTAYNISSADIDGDSIKNIFNWKVNGTPIAVLNMPFEQVNTTGGINGNALDYSGFRNNGSVSGATWNATGGYDSKGAYMFQGNDGAANYDRIIIAQNSSFKFNNTPFTVMAWAKHAAARVYGDTILGQGTAGNCVGAYSFRFDNANGNIAFYTNNGSGCGGQTSSVGTTVWANNTWYHVAGTFNGTHNKIYLNGVLQDTDLTKLPVTPSAEPLYLGWGHDTFHWNGTIDDVMIFNRSLSAEQILALYNNRTDLIVAQETTVGQNWSVEITPNDGYEDGQMLESNGVLILDKIGPTFSGAVNTSPNFRRYQNFTANITISDDVALDYYIFSTNASGAWANISTVDISGTSYSASEQANISTARGSPVCWLYYANDTSGNMVNSSLNCFTVANTFPTHTTPLLNSTDLTTNNTNVNLTAYNISSADVDGDSIKSIFNWKVNGTPIAVVNMPFEQINGTGGVNGNAFDYSGKRNNGSVSGATWNATGGYEGKGAYEFDGINDFINIPDNNNLDFANESFSFGLRFKTKGVLGVYSDYRLVSKRSGTSGFELLIQV